MNTGIQDGYNLAWKLALVLNDRASDELLNTYNEERLPNAEALMKTTDRFFNLAAGKNPFFAFARLYVFPYVAQFLFSLDVIKRFVFPRIAQIKINYRKSSLSKMYGSFRVKAGDRMPWVMVGNTSIYDHLREPSFHLVIFSDGKIEIPPLPDALLEEWKGRIDSHFFKLSNKVAAIFGSDRTFFLILRPDNYVGLISDDFSPKIVRDYLGKF